MTEPESAVDLTLATGELAAKTYLFGWLENDGDNIYETEEVVLFQPTLASALFNLKLAIADATTGGIPLPGVDDASQASKYIGLQWCVGTMSVVGTTITCNGSTVGNEVQTDKMTFDVGFYVEQSRNNQNFTCSSLNPVPQWNDIGTRTGGSVSFVQDGPRGTVLQLTTISNNDSRVRWNNDNLNHSLSGFTEMSYDSKQVSATDLINGNAAMRLMIDLDGDLTTADEQEITYEPYYNIAAHNPLNAASILPNVWQTWSTNMANGKFWANGGFLGSTPSGGAYATNFTLAQVLAAHPAAKISGISLGMGTYNPGQVVLVDNLIINGSELSLEN